MSIDDDDNTGIIDDPQEVDAFLREARRRQEAAWEEDPSTRPVPLTDAEVARVEKFIEECEAKKHAPN